MGWGGGGREGAGLESTEEELVRDNGCQDSAFPLDIQDAHPEFRISTCSQLSLPLTPGLCDLSEDAASLNLSFFSSVKGVAEKPPTFQGHRDDGRCMEAVSTGLSHVHVQQVGLPTSGHVYHWDLHKNGVTWYRSKLINNC